MPARLWQFGIYNFLEVPRHRLSESLDYMLAFIYTSYSMMTLLCPKNLQPRTAENTRNDEAGDFDAFLFRII